MDDSGEDSDSYGYFEEREASGLRLKEGTQEEEQEGPGGLQQDASEAGQEEGEEEEEEEERGDRRDKVQPYEWEWITVETPTELRGPARKGKWSPEEEAYTSRIIDDFNAGLLGLPPGTTLRSFLSVKLNCDPMRITKKFAGASCIGKRVFQPCVPTTETIAAMRRSKEQLQAMETKFLQRLLGGGPRQPPPKYKTDTTISAKRSSMTSMSGGGGGDIGRIPEQCAISDVDSAGLLLGFFKSVQDELEEERLPEEERHLSRKSSMAKSTSTPALSAMAGQEAPRQRPLKRQKSVESFLMRYTPPAGSS